MKTVESIDVAVKTAVWFMSDSPFLGFIYAGRLVEVPFRRKDYNSLFVDIIDVCRPEFRWKESLTGDRPLDTGGGRRTNTGKESGPVGRDLLLECGAKLLRRVRGRRGRCRGESGFRLRLELRICSGAGVRESNQGCLFS
jgi:hypothetical protein